jgi:LysR family glycine cleavage system transcriptional activator
MAPRPDRLPPLTALRAFEAAARRMSFAKAADELAVTPAALSYQIKQLEDHLGLPLFVRLNRAVELTEAGRLLRPGVAEGFEALRAAVRALDALREGKGLTVTAGPAFTAKWLAPRIFHFVERRPDVEVRIVASLRVMDFDRDGVDAAIRFGLRVDEAQYSEVLIRDRLTPLCAPATAARIREPADLLTAPLIHDDSMAALGWGPVWEDWFEAAGLDRPDWRRGARFSNADHALSAAAEGSAVVLGRVSLAEPELRAGRLAAPLPLALDPEAHYRFVCPRGAETRPAMAAFLAWLREETAATPDPAPHLRVATAPRLAAAAAAARG